LELRFAINSAADGSGVWTSSVITSLMFYTWANIAAPSLAAVAGKPAVAYQDESQSRLMYARSGQADGRGPWTISAVDGGGYVGGTSARSDSAGYRPSLGVVDGRPAIGAVTHISLAGGRGNSEMLQYYTNAAADGSGVWGALSLTSLPYTTLYNGNLTTFGGVPAIPYSVDTRIYLAIATNASGAGMWVHQLIDTNAMRVGPSAVQVDKFPTIAYATGISGPPEGAGLRVAVGATNAAVGAWKTRLVSTGSVSSVKLAAIGRLPVVVFGNGNNHAVRFAATLSCEGKADWIVWNLLSGSLVDAILPVNGKVGLLYDDNYRTIRFIRQD
jgi:hypothetical protein